MITRTTRQLALFSVLIATCLGVQLSPRPGNVEFTSLITFTLGVFFGGVIAGMFGASVMFVNGFLSPWGLAGMNMPFQMAGMIIIGVAGGIYRRYRTDESSHRFCAEAAILGAFLTLIFDLITNSGYAILTSIPIFLAFFAGMPMSVIHVFSNTVFFGFAFTPLSNVLQRFVGR